jgi:alkylhydroperoxidase/carboxymuconolactone decarboxylase family protein YurZ
MSSTPRASGRLPGRFLRFQSQYPEVFRHYTELGEATQAAGPLPAGTRALVKLAIAMGAGLEGAVHSHTRRALEAGCSPAEIRHVALLATTTIGFPGMMAALSWVDDILEPRESKPAS